MPHRAPTSLTDLLEGNRQWRSLQAAEDAEFFVRHAQGQRPPFLYIGCADSRVPPTTITNTGPGDLFVTRNIANLVRADDVAIQSTLEYAIDVLEVEHVLVCGHTECGGVMAALAPQPPAGALGAWIAPLRALALDRRHELDGLEHRARIDRLVRLNVEAQVSALERHPLVQRARERRNLQIHGSVYDLSAGQVQPLM